MDPTWFAERLANFIPVLLSLSVHECAHAWAALKLGDDTAQRLGRLTLDPLAHIDPVGTIILPLLGVPLGWARPVPVNPVRFRRDVRVGVGIALTAAAGPASNLVLAAICGAGLLLLPSGPVGRLLTLGATVNVALAVFNLLPIPPLDGSRMVEGFLPASIMGPAQVVGPYLLVALALLAYALAS